jgi:hypothetical protein
MDEVHLGEGLQGTPQQGQRDRRRAPQDAFEPGQALRVKAGGVEQHLQHAGHDDQIVHAFAGHDLDHWLGRKRGDGDAGAAHHRLAQHAAQPGHMEHGRGQQGDVMRRVGHLGHAPDQ